MAVSERTRHELYEAVRHALGDQPADTLMEMLPPVGWADVATKRDLDALGAATKRDIDAVRTEVRELREYVQGLPTHAALHSEINGAVNRLIFWLVPVLLAYGAALVRLG